VSQDLLADTPRGARIDVRARADGDAPAATGWREGVPLQARLAALRQHGRFCQSFSAAVQGGLQHFGDERGFIAYKKVWGTTMVLGDPVTSPRLADDLLDHFLAQHRDAAFWDASRTLANNLAKRGFRINEIGYETRIDLATYTFEGQSKRNLRKSIRRVEQLGYAIRECPVQSIDVEAIKAISEAWRHERPWGRREVCFLNRPVALTEEPDVRWFVAFDPDGKPVGYCVCDPIYKAGAVIGYSAASRQRPNLNLMLGHALKAHAMETFQREGKRWFHLGLSPFDGLTDKNFQSDWAVRRVLRWIYNSKLFNRYVYPLRGHSAHKKQFGGQTAHTYIAIRRKPGFVRAIKLLRACNFI
jgi:lysylphosphatidylglycerol synthetase-like protein (DUF2156 family)